MYFLLILTVSPSSKGTHSFIMYITKSCNAQKDCEYPWTWYNVSLLNYGTDTANFSVTFPLTQIDIIQTTPEEESSKRAVNLEFQVYL